MYKIAIFLQDNYYGDSETKMKNKLIYYSVGPLMYCPANQNNIVDSLLSQRFGKGYSLALCLEDTIADDYVEEAEIQLIHSLQSIYNARQYCDIYLPDIFIRVREPQQIFRIFSRLGAASELVLGIIVPKFSLENADLYVDSLVKLNSRLNTHKYIMPIYESASIIDKRYRYNNLYQLKDKLDEIEENVLNIRVGGNDLCHLFGFRRSKNESIHDIKPISDIFTDIITVYGQSYVVSGPVWEYFSGDGWDIGLKNEIHEDILCGFIGKTVIHPKQIAVVNDSYKVSRQNFDDALSIINWNTNDPKLVHANSNHERMNEYKTHYNWAEKILFLAEHYGIHDQQCSQSHLSPLTLNIREIGLDTLSNRVKLM